MIYFNNTTYKVYFYGDIINFYSLFNYRHIDVLKLNVNDKIKFILSNIFIPAKSNDENIYYDNCKSYVNVKFTHLVGNNKVIVNNDIIDINDFYLKYLNKDFNKTDLIMIDNSMEYHETVL